MAASIKIQAQGEINFANVGVGLNAPVFDVDGVTRLAGPAFQAELYVGSSASESSLTAVPGTVPFLSGTSAGYFTGGTKTLPGYPPGSRPFFQVRVWEVAGGVSYDAAMAAGAKYGKSTVFQLIGGLGGPGPPPGPVATLLGLTSFSLVSEPSAMALGALGGAIFLLLGRLSERPHSVSPQSQPMGCKNPSRRTKAGRARLLSSREFAEGVDSTARRLPVPTWQTGKSRPAVNKESSRLATI